MLLVFGGGNDRTVERDGRKRGNVRVDDKVAIKVENAVKRRQKFGQENARINRTVGVF